MRNLALKLLPRSVLIGGVTIVAVAGTGGCSRREQTLLEPPVRPSLDAFPAALTSAIAEAEAAIGQRPRDAAAWLELGRLYHANGYIDQAAACYGAIHRDPAVGARACHGLALLAQLRGDLQEELRWLDETLARDGSYTPAELRRALARFKAGDRSAAAQSFRTVLEREPANAEAQLGLARIRLQSGDERGAQSMLEKVTAEHPGFSSGFALLAQIAQRQGETARSGELRRQAQMRKDPPISDPWLDETMEHCFDAQQLALRFEDFAKSGRQDQALATLRRLEAVAPDHALVHQMRGLAAAQQGRERDALREYETALAQGARTPEMLVAVAVARLNEGDAATALARLEEALKLAPEHPEANVTLARLHWEAGRRAAAVPYLETVRRVVPHDLAARAMLGEYMLEEARPAEAVRVLAEAHALAPEHDGVRELLALAHVRVGNSLARQGGFADALAAYDRAIAVRPGSLEAYANKVQILVRLQRSDDALRAIEAWIESQPAEPAAWLMLGDVQRANGQPEQSRESWSRAQQLLAKHPNPHVQEALRKRLEAAATPRLQ